MKYMMDYMQSVGHTHTLVCLLNTSYEGGEGYKLVSE